MLTKQYTNKQYGGNVKCHFYLHNNEQQITDPDLLPKQTAQIYFVLVHHTNEVTYIRQFQHTPMLLSLGHIDLCVFQTYITYFTSILIHKTLCLLSYTTHTIRTSIQCIRLSPLNF